MGGIVAVRVTVLVAVAGVLRLHLLRLCERTLRNSGGSVKIHTERATTTTLRARTMLNGVVNGLGIALRVGASAMAMLRWRRGDESESEG